MIKNKAELETKYGKDAAKVWHDAFGQRMDSPEIQKLSNKYGSSVKLVITLFNIVVSSNKLYQISCFIRKPVLSSNKFYYNFYSNF